LKQRCHFKI